MKQYILLLLSFCMFFKVASSQNKTSVKNGTHLEYLYDLHGQKKVIKFDFKFYSDTLEITWKLKGIKGSYALTALSIDSGNKLYNKQAIPFQTILLKNDETICFISKFAYQNLIKKNRFIYDETTYVLDSLSDNDSFFEVNNKRLPVLHVKAQKDETEIWILKNSDFPLICKLDLNPLGINYSLITFDNL